jgi:hypothetical protein
MGERRRAKDRIVRPRHHGEPFVEDLVVTCQRAANRSSPRR